MLAVDMILDFLSRCLNDWNGLNSTSSVALALVFVSAPFLVVPRTILLIGAGAAFGLKSLFIIMPCTTLGSILSFLLARHFFSGWFQRFVDRRPKLKAISAVVDAESWRIVAIMRLGVPIPSALQNYMFGLTRVRVLPYALATFFFSIPQAALFVFLGLTGREALASNQDSFLGQLPLALGGASTLMLIFLIRRHALREFRSLSGSRP
jgi:uncharacterized membrane protein YdjX (TVP38/TMEM64 family)